jgi:hypothetical protein
VHASASQRSDRAPVAICFPGMPAKRATTGRIGRLRPATKAEVLAPESVFRPDAVLALIAPAPGDLPVGARRVAALVDGFRPVARLRAKSGLTSADLRLALAELAGRGLLAVESIVEGTDADVGADGDADDGGTMPRGSGDAIPPRVMAEIQAMLDEVETQEGFDEPTDVMPTPQGPRSRG